MVSRSMPEYTPIKYHSQRHQRAAHCFKNPPPHQNFATLDIRLTYRICRQLKLRLDLDNITNTHYQVIYGHPLPGFTAMGGFTLTILKNNFGYFANLG